MLTNFQLHNVMISDHWIEMLPKLFTKIASTQYQEQGCCGTKEKIQGGYRNTDAQLMPRLRVRTTADSAVGATLVGTLVGQLVA